QYRSGCPSDQYDRSPETGGGLRESLQVPLIRHITHSCVAVIVRIGGRGPEARTWTGPAVGPEGIEPSTRGLKVRQSIGRRACTSRSEGSYCYPKRDGHHCVAVSAAVKRCSRRVGICSLGMVSPEALVTRALG